MKKFALIALLALISAPVFAFDGTSSVSTSVEVTLEITDFCQLTVDTVANQSVSGGVGSAVFTTTAHSRANFDYNLSLLWAWTSTKTLANPTVTIGGGASVSHGFGNTWNDDAIVISFVWDLSKESDYYAGTLTVNLGV